MEEILTPLNVISWIIGIVGVVIGVYKSITSPQTDLDKREALNDEKSLSKAQLLAQQVQWEREATERRFKEISENNREALALAQNHIHTVDTKVTDLAKRMTGVEGAVIKLTTIIDERIPAKA